MRRRDGGAVRARHSEDHVPQFPEMDVSACGYAPVQGGRPFQKTPFEQIMFPGAACVRDITRGEINLEALMSTLSATQF